MSLSLQLTNAATIDAGIVGKSLATHGPKFPDLSNPAAPARNASCWLNTLSTPVVLTEESYYNDARGANSADQNKQHGCLLYSGATYSIMAIAYHYDPYAPVGSKFRWCSDANIVEESTIVAQSINFEGTYNGTTYHDFVLCKMSPALSEDIGVFEVLPADWMYYLMHLPLDDFADGGLLNPLGNGFPVVRGGFGNGKRASIVEWRQDGTLIGGQGMATGSPFWNADRVTMSENGVSGDSGSAVYMLPGGGRKILCGLLSSDTIASNYAAINVAMNALVPGAALTEADLSTFTKEDGFVGVETPDGPNGFESPHPLRANGIVAPSVTNGFGVPA